MLRQHPGRINEAIDIKRIGIRLFIFRLGNLSLNIRIFSFAKKLFYKDRTVNSAVFCYFSSSMVLVVGSTVVVLGKACMLEEGSKQDVEDMALGMARSTGFCHSSSLLIRKQQLSKRTLMLVFS